MNADGKEFEKAFVFILFCLCLYLFGEHLLWETQMLAHPNNPLNS